VDDLSFIGEKRVFNAAPRKKRDAKTSRDMDICAK